MLIGDGPWSSRLATAKALARRCDTVLGTHRVAGGVAVAQCGLQRSKRHSAIKLRDPAY